MFPNKGFKLRSTLSLRLTIWYATVFTITSFIALSIFYWRISTVTMKNTDNELLEETQEFNMFMSTGGADQVRHQLEFEAAEEGSSVFFRLLSPDGEVLKALNMGPFQSVGVSGKALAALSSGNKTYVIETVDIPNDAHDIRTIYSALAPDLIFNMGFSLEDSHEFLSVFRNLIFLLMAPLFLLAALVGWLLARHALKGVQDVTQTAREISKGSIDRRVSVKRRSYEIDQLASTFNDMLDRIQELIENIREMNDNIAHDLRSPLTRIRGIAEMTLVSKSTTEDYREMAISTIEECDKLIDIINTMLDITETEAGVSQMETGQVDVVALISSACELFDPIAQDKEVRIVTTLPETLMMQVDKNRLQRIVSNLLENAIKYNRRGGIVTVSADKKNNRVHIQVKDTGIGIAQSDIPNIFERFYRCDASRFEPGIGLGLSLAKAIAKALGGDIRVESDLDKGSSFFLSLPV